METFKKRQKEMRRLERQRDKAAKRAEIKARKVAGIANPSDEDVEAAANAAPSNPAADPAATDEAILNRPEGGTDGDSVLRF